MTKNIDLISGRFEDVRIYHIQSLDDDKDNVYGTSREFFEYCRGTIENLMEKGYQDGQGQFNDIIR